MHPHEAVGPNFCLSKFLSSRKKGLEIVRACAKYVQPGMAESELRPVIEEEAQKRGLERWWHPIKIRFAQNTKCSFKDISNQDPPIKEGDLFFFDIGPVFQGHEADLGQTYRLGDENFCNPAELVFKKCQDDWKQYALKGHELYQRAHKYAQELGLELNPKMAGHRLSDFPHALHYRGSLEGHQSSPLASHWVLEIHLRDAKRGYFFEDLL